MKFLKMALLGVLVIAFAAYLPGIGSATLISHVDSTVTFDGVEYTYDYVLSNDASSTENIWVFTIYPEAGIFDIASPTGWTMIFTDYLTFVKWPSDFGMYDILPGSSQAGFGFKSFTGPGEVDYDVEGSYASGLPTDTLHASTTTGPVPVPEPGTFILFFGLVSFACYVKRKEDTGV